MLYETYFRLTANKQKKILNISTSALLHSERFSVMWRFLCWSVHCFLLSVAEQNRNCFFNT